MSDLMSWQKWYNIFLESAKEGEEKGTAVSPVHKTDHLLRVWENAKILCEKLHGDLEIMVAAVMLHDLGRHYGIEIHGEKSAELAKPILEKSGFPGEKIPSALEAIAQHDYTFPKEKRKRLEARILYDADKMDAFGVIGVYRHVIFVEKGRMKLEEVVPALNKRFDGFALPESKKLAKGDYEYIVNFFKVLEKELGGEK
ncbi:MAG: HD domain-containing protein [Candidatus Diapherotrites archaeon]